MYHCHSAWFKSTCKKKQTFLQKLHKLRLCLYFSFVGSFAHFYSFAAFPVVVGYFLAHIVNGQYMYVYGIIYGY